MKLTAFSQLCSLPYSRLSVFTERFSPQALRDGTTERLRGRQPAFVHQGTKSGWSTRHFPLACGQGFSHYRLGTSLTGNGNYARDAWPGGFKDAVPCTSLLVSYRVTTEVREHESTESLVITLTCLDHWTRAFQR